MNKKPGRNDPCHCGSGKKYKNCCFVKDNTPVHQRKIKATWIKPAAANEPEPLQQDIDLMERTFGAHKSLMEKEAPQSTENDTTEKSS